MPLKIIVTPRYLIGNHLWDKYCTLHQVNPWAINEGLINDTDQIELTLKEADELGLRIIVGD